MRTRTRNIVTEWFPIENAGSYGYTIVPCVGNQITGSTSVGALPIAPAKSVDEVMSDGLGKNLTHSCRHRRLQLDLSTGGDGAWFPNTSPDGVVRWDGLHSRKGRENAIWCADGIRNWNYYSGSESPPRFTISYPTLNEQVVINDLIQRSRQLKADVMLDLVEGHQLWPTLRGMSLCLPAMAYNWRSIRKVIKVASSSFLAWKFGISPIFSDILAIKRSLPQLAASLDNIGNARYRYSKAFVANVKYDATPIIDYTYKGVSLYERQYQGLISRNPTIRYVLVVEPNVQYTIKAFKALEGTLQRFGTSPASLAWETIPFSFVVDWFYDVRGALRGIDQALGISPWKLVSFTKSTSYDISAEGFMIRRTPCDGSILTSSKMASAKYTHYERSLVSIGANAPQWKPRYGKTQAALSAALIGQQLLKAVKVRVAVEKVAEDAFRTITF